MLQFNFPTTMNSESKPVTFNSRTYTIIKTLKGKTFDIILKDGFMVAAEENTGNLTFKRMVSSRKLLNQQINEWANKLFQNNYHQCDLCNTTTVILPLSLEDKEDFPEIADKFVCSQCLQRFYDKYNDQYDKKISELVKEHLRAKADGFIYGYELLLTNTNGDDYLFYMYTHEPILNPRFNKNVQALRQKHNCTFKSAKEFMLDELINGQK